MWGNFDILFRRKTLKIFFCVIKNAYIDLAPGDGEWFNTSDEKCGDVLSFSSGAKRWRFFGS